MHTRVPMSETWAAGGGIIRPEPVQRVRQAGPVRYLPRVFLLCLVLMLLGLGPARADSPVDVTIKGLNDELQQNVRSFLSIADDNVPDNPPDRLIRRLNKRAPSEIREALQPFGYYQPAIQSHLDKENGAWHATYHIQHGPPTRIRTRDIRVVGPGAKRLQSAVEAIALKSGRRLRQSVYKDAKQQLLEAAYENGYLDAEFKHHELKVHPKKRVADIHLVLATGPLYRFGHITIQQDILSQNFVQRFVTIPYGARFDSRRLLNLQVALSDSGYFSRSEIVVKKQKAHPYKPRERGKSPAGSGESGEEGPARVVPVVIRTQPEEAQKYTAGVGYGTDTGPRVHGGIVLRRLNRWGHSFETRLELSFIRQALTARYSIPIGNISNDRLDFSAGAIKEDFGDGTSRRYTVGVDRRDRWLGFERIFSLHYLHERYRFSSDRLSTRLLMPGFALSRKSTDRAVFPRLGYSFSIDVHGSADRFISSTRFLQQDTNLHAVFPLGPRGRVITSLEFGTNITTNFEKLPPSERFFAGGSRSVRGYPYQSLGPENSNGDVVGGKYLLAGSVEMDYLVWGPYGFALFFDAGNAFNSFPPQLKAGTGAGFRWKSPFGMVRLDFAHPLDNSRLVMVHFSFGPML